MHFLFLLLLIPITNTFVAVKIHRDSLYYPQSSCAFIGNTSFLNDASIQLCIWECVHEQNCQTAVYYKDKKLCSMYSEGCQSDRIRSLRNTQSSVICYRKNINPISTCPLSTTMHPKDEEETTTLDRMTTTITEVLLTDTNETIFGVWNATAGRDSHPATPGYSVGNYVPTQSPDNTFDRDCSTKYVNFGAYDINITSNDSGINTGFYLTPNRGSSLLTAVQFCTADDFPERDPLTMTIEGSNHNSTALSLGSSWTLIYNGTTGLDNTTQRYTNGTKIWLSNNSNRYSSYRLLVTSKRYQTNGVQYSEVDFFVQ